MSKQPVDICAQEKILKWLDETWEEYRRGYDTDFLLGKIYAYVECMELILQSEGVSDEMLRAFEERYGIR